MYLIMERLRVYRLVSDYCLVSQKSLFEQTNSSLLHVCSLYQTFSFGISIRLKRGDSHRLSPLKTFRRMKSRNSFVRSSPLSLVIVTCVTKMTKQGILPEFCWNSGFPICFPIPIGMCVPATFAPFSFTNYLPATNFCAIFRR